MLVHMSRNKQDTENADRELGEIKARIRRAVFRNENFEIHLKKIRNAAKKNEKIIQKIRCGWGLNNLDGLIGWIPTMDKYVDC